MALPRILSILILAILGSACLRSSAQSRLAAQQPLASTTDGCHPLKVEHCVLPWPSNHFTVKDPKTPSGLRVVLPNEVISPQTLSQLPASVRPQEIFADSDGFSAAGSILFEFDGLIDEARFETQKNAYIHVYDLTTGVEAKNIAISISKLASETTKTYIEIYPEVRWEYGHEYVALMQFGFLSKNGTGPNRVPAIDRVLAEPAAFGGVYAKSLKFIASQGIDHDSILSMTHFTVRSRENVMKPLIDAKNIIANMPHPVRNLKVIHQPHASLAAIVYGELLATDFTDTNRGINFQKISVGRSRWVQFVLTLPKVAYQDKAPIAIYAHGLGFFKEAALVQAYDNAAKGFATIAIDHPYHGNRVIKGDPYLLRMINHQHLPEMVSLSFQITSDHMSLFYALKDTLADLDVLPKATFRQEGELVTADGLPDLDSDFVIFQGLSLGGVMGSAFAAMMPLDGAFLQVSGVNISRILAHSVLWPRLFSNLVPPGTALAEVAFAMSAYQQIQDYGDGINFIDYYDDELKANGSKKIAVIYGLGDQIVGNFGSLGVARLLKIPVLRPVLDARVGLQESSGFVEGAGVVQLKPWLDGTSAAALTAHFTMFSEHGRKALNEWFEAIKKLKADNNASL